MIWSFNGMSFDELQLKMQLIHYQQLANQIIETYDYNDIKRGIKYAKDNTQKPESLDNQEKLEVIDVLFKNLIGWLEKNGKKV